MCARACVCRGHSVSFANRYFIAWSVARVRGAERISMPSLPPDIFRHTAHTEWRRRVENVAPSFATQGWKLACMIFGLIWKSHHDRVSARVDRCPRWVCVILYLKWTISDRLDDCKRMMKRLAVQTCDGLFGFWWAKINPMAVQFQLVYQSKHASFRFDFHQWNAKRLKAWSLLWWKYISVQHVVLIQLHWQIKAFSTLQKAD